MGLGRELLGKIAAKVSRMVGGGLAMQAKGKVKEVSMTGLCGWGNEERGDKPAVRCRTMGVARDLLYGQVNCRRWWWCMKEVCMWQIASIM
jgi:hypothetical protein